MSVNFQEALNQKIEDVERPPLPPLGTFKWKIDRIPDFREVGDGAYDIVDFLCRVVEANEDVDQADIEAYGAPITNITVRYSFMFNKEDAVKFQQTLFRMRTFLEDHLQCATASDTLKEGLANSVNSVFVGELKYRQDKVDKELMYPEIGATAPVE